MTYDAIIVGARCAGSPTAMLLGRKGHRVLLLDRATFPSDTLSTHYIHQPGVARLKRWGLLDRILASNCPPISRALLDSGALTLRGGTSLSDGTPDAYSPRRQVLDKILVDAAVDAGVELRAGFSVQELLWEGDCVSGIRGHTKGGALVTERARIVIGADGMRSMIARAVQAPTYKTRPALGCAYYSYWGGIPMDGAEVYLRPRNVIILWPTNNGLTLIFVEWAHHEFHKIRADVERNYLQAIDSIPSLAERVRGGRRGERFTGTADLANFFRRPYGSGWALVGDAGYHRDPVTGQGITDTFRDAELLAKALDAGFSGRESLAPALADYEHQRNRAVEWMYRLTCYLARWHTLPGGNVLIRAVSGDQEATDNLLGMFVGTVRIPEFLSPLKLMRLVGRRFSKGRLTADPTPTVKMSKATRSPMKNSDYAPKLNE